MFVISIGGLPATAVAQDAPPAAPAHDVEPARLGEEPVPTGAATGQTVEGGSAFGRFVKAPALVPFRTRHRDVRDGDGAAGSLRLEGGLPFFAAATYTAISRVTIKKYWASDVTMGG